MQYLIKTILSAIIIVVVSELSKRNSFWGGLLASLPMVSVLAMIWLYHDTKSNEKIVALSHGIFWMVIPSLSLFVILPALLKKNLPFYPAMIVACVLTAFVYYGATLLYKRFGITL